jgi:hypothetical protein
MTPLALGWLLIAGGALLAVVGLYIARKHP